MKTIGKLTGIIALIAIFSVQVLATNYNVDKSKSTVKWNGKKVTGEHYGTINLKSGTLEVADKMIKSGTFKMDMTSIVCVDITSESTNQKLVGHLKSDDFFSVEKHPVSTLVLKKVKSKSGKVHTFSGDLTIKGITHPVTFDAEVALQDETLQAKGKIEVDRTLYDIRYGSGKFFDSLGDNMIHDTFTLDFDVVASGSSGMANIK
ncbi:Polyisoprenoid-binding protein YceI [Mariniphaga anaerophila]|uniref:Polyisoprenoid-binding protein YceI n=1 Tax=Mariniphaga anaerophila TaxID=1484053 RepID=A0A1M5EJI1_9BACT|nr:YceI family protein [Mariniphaga anaerophila]SHF79326.1 Polyisoprenoid-binding protein YceI [Mariniphaga anaerophila]